MKKVYIVQKYYHDFLSGARIMREVIFVFSSERKAKENLIRLMKEEPLPGVGYELKAFPVT